MGEAGERYQRVVRQRRVELVEAERGRLAGLGFALTDGSRVEAVRRWRQRRPRPVDGYARALAVVTGRPLPAAGDAR